MSLHLLRDVAIVLLCAEAAFALLPLLYVCLRVLRFGQRLKNGTRRHLPLWQARAGALQGAVGGFGALWVGQLLCLASFWEICRRLGKPRMAQPSSRLRART
jgi:hypothetical protein